MVESNFEQGKRIGYGRYIYSSGSYYEGYWRNSDWHGEGKYVQEGNWEEGTLIEGDDAEEYGEEEEDNESSEEV